MSWEIAQKSIDIWLQDFSPNVWYVIELFGGEPLLCFDLIKKIEEYVSKIEIQKNFKVSYRMVTNGTILTESIINFLKEHPYFFLTVSCDGIKEIHDKNRKTITGEGSFDLVEKNLRILQKHNLFQNKKTKINMVVTPETVGYFYKNYKFFSEFDPNLEFSENFFQATKWTSSDFKIYENQIQLIIEDEKQKLLNQEKCRYFVVFDMIKKFITGNCRRYVCQAARPLGMTVDSQGDIFLCHRFESLKRDKKLKHKINDFYLGNIMEYQKLDIKKWLQKKEKLTTYIKENKYPDCQKCQISNYCTWIRCFWNNYAVYFDLYKHNSNVCKKLAYFLRPTQDFYHWLEAENLLNPYLKGFGYIPPEERPVSFVTKKLTPTEPVEN